MHPALRRFSLYLLSLVLLSLAGCGDDTAAPDADASEDASADDSSSDGAGEDGFASDATTGDGGAPDAATLDAAPADAGEPREVSARVREWQTAFDEEWARALPTYTDESAGRPETSGQRRYYDFRVIDGLIHIFQATGDTKYIDDLIWYVDRLVGLAYESDDGYYDWPVAGVNAQLYDGHGLRNIFQFLWLLKRHPELRAMSNYQEKYDEYLPWFTTNLWDKWESRGCGAIFRSRTHMASHMASNMALYLHLLEDDADQKARYLSYVEAWNDDISALCPSAADAGVGFRDQLRVDSRHGGYVWSGSWGVLTGSNDIGHSNAGVQSVINQHQHGIGWTRDEIDLFGLTMNALLDASPSGDFAELPYDLFAIYDEADDNRPFVNYGWSMLGRFDPALQSRLNGFSTRQFRSSFYYNDFIGIMALNQAHLDGYVVYED